MQCLKSSVECHHVISCYKNSPMDYEYYYYEYITEYRHAHTCRQDRVNDVWGEKVKNLVVVFPRNWSMNIIEYHYQIELEENGWPFQGNIIYMRKS